MDTRPRWTLILNGKSAGDEEVRGAVAALRADGVQLDVRVTWEGGDAERYVAQAISAGVDTIIAGGGDGTLSEVATTLAHREESAHALPSLGLLPLGTANDFAAAACVPERALPALRLVRDAPAVPVDLLRLHANDATHWAANLASGGFGTEVTTDTPESLKAVLGGLAYAITGLARLGRIEPQALRVTGPGFAWEGAFIALAIGNGRQAGGGQVLCPEALIDDGLLDLTIVPPLDGELLATVGTVLAEGKQAALDRVALRRAMAWVELQAAQPFTLNLDGEPVRATRFRADCVPGRLRMHLPADCPLRGDPARVGP